MPQTYQQVNAALDALQPIMMQKGLLGRTQIALMRLWRSLQEPAAVFAEAEMAAIREYGSIKPDGKTIQFRDDEARAAYSAKLADMFAAEITPIPPVVLRPDPVFFAATDPGKLAALAPFIEFAEGSENA